ncbi:P-loop containing nucleoside triphosphate hydrolase protein [Xylariales sp. AK1849]|nr:P-loop containing nucleoside triphosphate hydrolase protein [Xylariales sp. AK1849]
MDTTKVLLCEDDSFGPSVKSPDCRGGFDFTILFEESVLAILPAACFLLLTPFRALRLLRRRIRVRRNGLYICKLTAIGAYIGLQLALLILTSNPRVRTHITIASAALSLGSGLALALLSHLEHAKTIRPSFLINTYLLTTVLFDAARARTQWLIRTDDGVAGALTGSLVIKCIMLSLEAVEKRSLFLGLDRQFSVESTSGLISRSSFWWLNSLLLSGYKNVLTMDDLPAIHEKLSSEHLGDQLQTAWDKCNQSRKHALAMSSTWSLRWEVLAVSVPKFCFVALSISQTYLIQAAVKYVEEADSPDSNTGYGLIAAFGLVYIGSAIMMGWAAHLTFRLMTMMRGQLTSIIYTKMSTLPITGVNESAAMTLMGTDVQGVAASFHYLLIDLVPSVVQLGIAVYVLYLQLGPVCVAPILVTIVSTGLSTLIAAHITSRQKAWYQAIQRRINYTSEILGGMRSAKMLGLTKQLSENIQQMRDDELGISKTYRKIQALNISLVNLPSVFNTFLIFAAYAIAAQFQGRDSLSVSQAVTALAALTILSQPLSNLLVAIPMGRAALGCFERIQAFLLETSRTDFRTIRSPVPNPSPSRDSIQDVDGLELRPLGGNHWEPMVQVEGSDFGWSDSSSSIVKEVTTSIRSETKLTFVVGPVGCGKSTFLKGLLGETPKARGRLSISTSQIAYCDQTPWIINGSIRENVMAASGLDDAWYRTVMQACALDIDMRQLPSGDSTVVGSKGVKLSGGQKQRLSIARAVYSRKPLAILDDVLSGLDAVTEAIVFSRVLGPDGLFQNSNTHVILATHSVKHLPQAHLILALDQTGRIIEQGTFDELKVAGNYIESLQVKLGVQSRTEPDSESQTGQQCTTKPVDPDATVSDQARKTGDWATYKYYGRSLGLWALAIFVSSVAFSEIFFALCSVWINWWAHSNENGGDHDLGYWLGLFASFSFLNGAGMVGAIAWHWIHIVPRSGSNLHRSILEAAMKAPLSFFAKTETGVLVNRFSQDIRLCDMVLPGSIINVAFQLGACFVVLALSVTAVGYFAAVLPAVCVVLYFIQRFYLRTSRQLRLLEIEANAPLYSHFIETLSGLVTIRSFGWNREYSSKNRRLLDDSQKPYYLLLCIQRWLVLVLDLVVAGLAVLLVGMAVALRSRLNAGFLGIALVSMINLSHALTNLVQYYTLLETSLGAIARIKDFSENTPVENLPGEDDSVDPNWPSRGALRFESVSASYGQDTAPVLKDVSFSVEGGEKIGIVGRTGSGKSSSTLAIMRMIDLTSGKIILDGVDLSTLQGSLIRERIICLTQDPFLFPDSIRSNVDPLHASSDEAIAEALRKVGLWTVLQDKVSDENGGVAGVLDTLMDTDFLSHGQRQLFCLARAMLKQGQVLILDEPTSRQLTFWFSVDTQTDAQMQQIIRSEFQNHTIIMIAHRLSSLTDFDRVAVLDGGRLVEYGVPTELLRDSASDFSRLYQGSA